MQLTNAGALNLPFASPTFTYDPSVPSLTLVGSNGLTEAPFVITVGDVNGRMIHLKGGATNEITSDGGLLLTAGGGVWSARASSGNIAIQIGAADNIALGDQSALATNATNGWPHMRNSPGAPTGVPTLPFTGMNPFQYDELNHKLWVYDRGAAAWKGIILL